MYFGRRESPTVAGGGLANDRSWCFDYGERIGGEPKYKSSPLRKSG